MLLVSAKMLCLENQFGKFAKCSETITTLTVRLWIHMRHSMPIPRRWAMECLLLMEEANLKAKNDVLF